MGTVAIALKIMPESPDVDLNAIRQEISKFVKIQDAKIEPLAFGLSALKILLTTPDKTGGTEEVEKKIRALEGVAEVEVESVTLI